MNNKALLFIFFVFCGLGSTFAQKLFPKKADDFIKTFSAYLNSGTENKDTTIVLAVNEAWSNNFNKKQKKHFIGLANYAITKKVRRHPFFYTAFGSISKAALNKNLPAEEIDTLIYSIKYALDTLGYKSLCKSLKTLYSFINEGALYTSNYNSLFANSKSFRVRYKKPKPIVEVNIDDDDEEEEQGEEEYFDSWDEDGYEDEWTDEEWDTSSQLEDEEESLSVEDEIDETILTIGYTPPEQPLKEGWYIEFDKVDLVFKTKYDTTEVKKTSGYLLLKTGQFVGNGGSMAWNTDRDSLGKKEEIFGTFKEYNFNINAPKLEAEGVTLSYPEKLQDTIQGIFVYKGNKSAEGKPSQYPRFMAYNNDVEIKGLGEGIEYKGGFALNGQRIYSESVNGGKSEITVYHNNEKKFRARASSFIFRDSIIQAQPVSVSVYMKDDSLYHLGLSFFYNRNTKELKTFKNKTNFKRAPFIDTYHNLEIFVDAVLWNLNDSTFKLTNFSAKGEVPALFESKDYYNLKKYTVLKGLYPFHPLQLIVYYSKKKNKRKFNLENLYNYFRTSRNVKKETLKSAMVALMERGFIDFNTINGDIYLKDKSIHYVKSLKNKTDFDNVLITSINPGAYNAEYNLNNNVIEVNGVDTVKLSDSLGVYFIPKNRKVRIKENRDFTFDGEIHTANYIFIGRDFEFSYDQFNVNLENIDSIEFRVDIRDTITGQKKGDKKLSNKLVYSSGILYINEPDNKSARKKIPKYPYFDASSGAYVYFDSDEYLHGTYNRDLYFYIPPFKQDSLSSNDKESVGFEGEFNSAGIFPVFEDRVKIMSDYTMGLKHKVPDGGYSLYGGNGKFYNELSMDGQGLQGNGSIEFYNTVLKSKKFTFFPDSVLSQESSVKITPGIHPDMPGSAAFPDLSANSVQLLWYPQRDSMYLVSKDEPFSFYDSTATLEGTAIVTTKGLYGSGILNTRGSRAFSDKISFTDNQYQAREALFEVLSDDPIKPALKAENTKMRFELDSGLAYFSPEVEGEAANEFPYLMYKSSMDNGEWDLNNKVITMKMPDGGDIKKSYFYSTHPEQDSLVINAEYAEYDMSEQVLNIMGIPRIRVADAFIIPDSNQVTIRENAQMDSLFHAEILLDTSHMVHDLYDATVRIHSANKFTGEAYHDYVNFGNDTLKLKFSQFQIIEPDDPTEQRHTKAISVAHVEDSLYIAPEMQFKGYVLLLAHKEKLHFDGQIHLTLHGLVKLKHWMRFESVDDSDALEIKLDNPASAGGKPLVSGIHLSKWKKLYNTFLDIKRRENDRDIFDASGYLIENIDSNEFVVTSQDYLHNVSRKDNRIRYDEKHEKLRFDGNFSLIDVPVEQSRYISMKTYGSCVNDLIDSLYSLNALSLINFEYPGSAQKKMLERLQQIIDLQGVEKAIVANDSLALKLTKVFDDKVAQTYLDEFQYNYKPLKDLGKVLSKGFVFSDVTFHWNEENKAWYSERDLSLANVDKTDLNFKMKGAIEVKYGKKGDEVTLLLEPNDKTWYYFNFKDNSLSTGSSDPEYNKIISSKSTMEKSQLRGLYFVANATSVDKNRFRNRYMYTYLGDSSSAFQIEEDFEDDDEEDYDDEEFEDSEEDYEDSEYEEEDDADEEIENEESYEDDDIEDSYENETIEDEDEIINEQLREDKAIEEKEGQEGLEEKNNNKKKKKKDRNQLNKNERPINEPEISDESGPLEANEPDENIDEEDEFEEEYLEDEDEEEFEEYEDDAE